MQADPWAFGWTQVFTLIGFVITLVIAGAGFRSFDRWKRERLEERRIEIAFEVLSIAHESKYVFQFIRGPLVVSYEWEDMPEHPGENDAQRRLRGSYYAVKKRIVSAKPFFDKVFAIQPKCMAIFGAHTEDIFMLLHRSRREIEVSCDQLIRKVLDGYTPTPDPNAEFWEQCRRDVSDHGDFQKEKDKVGKKLTDFRSQVEKLCRPVIDKGFGKNAVP